jgi:hypothetical protein
MKHGKALLVIKAPMVAARPEALPFSGRLHLNFLSINKLAMEHECRGEKFFALALKRTTALATKCHGTKDFSPLRGLRRRPPHRSLNRAACNALASAPGQPL